MIRSRIPSAKPLAVCTWIGGAFVLAAVAGCSQAATVEALDLRAIDIARAEGAQPLRVVLGIRDFDGPFSEDFRTSQTLLGPEDRKRWRDMGVAVFPDRIADYLHRRGTVLDAKRAHQEAADLILSARLITFRRDWMYDQATIPLVYVPVNMHKWAISSRIEARFSLADPLGRTLKTFDVKMSLPAHVFRRTGLGFSQTGMPKEVDDEYGGISRVFLAEVLGKIEEELIAARDRFTYLERPDLERAQNLSDELLRGTPRNQWAVVVGISRYQRGGTQFPDLQFAARDANAFAEFLLSPKGGGFKKEHVLLLSDAEATYSAIRNGLFTFLKDAEEDDLVIVFFSCHGAPDPERPDNLFLLPHDVNPGAIASTAFPMWDMEKVLWQIIRAQRVVVFADACHSAGVTAGLGAKGIGTAAAPETIYNRYFRRLAHTRPGRVVFSSSGGYEQSLEGGKWDRHGVFTWALLKGLRGEADGFLPGTQKDGFLSLQEVIKFVEHRVVEETRNKQHPFLAASPKYDVDLPLAIVAPPG